MISIVAFGLIRLVGSFHVPNATISFGGFLVKDPSYLFISTIFKANTNFHIFSARFQYIANPVIAGYFPKSLKITNSIFKKSISSVILQSADLYILIANTTYIEANKTSGYDPKVPYAYVYVSSCSFYDCVATISMGGGALKFSKQEEYSALKIEVNYSNFVNCQAPSDKGGAISINYYRRTSINSCMFYSCFASTGGAISLTGVNNVHLIGINATECSSVSNKNARGSFAIMFQCSINMFNILMEDCTCYKSGVYSNIYMDACSCNIKFGISNNAPNFNRNVTGETGVITTFNPISFSIENYCFNASGSWNENMNYFPISFQFQSGCGKNFIPSIVNVNAPDPFYEKPYTMYNCENVFNVTYGSYDCVFYVEPPPTSLFNQSNLFTESILFGKSLEFSESEIFSGTSNFNRTNIFSNSNKMAASKAFSQSMFLEPTHLFSFSKVFKQSQTYSNSNRYTYSHMFSPSNTKSDTITDYTTTANRQTPTNNVNHQSSFDHSQRSEGYDGQIENPNKKKMKNWHWILIAIALLVIIIILIALIIICSRQDPIAYAPSDLDDDGIENEQMRVLEPLFQDSHANNFINIEQL